jgi:Flp pilus assembly protein CpaB
MAQEEVADRMRASTIFALIAAVLLGLGAAVAIKYTGWLDRKPEVTRAAQPVLLLVAANNLYEGTFLQATDVKVRAAKTDAERQAAQSGQLLPAVVQAAVKRTTRTTIPADTPIRIADLEELTAPQSLSERIPPCDRGVHCCLNKQYCAGGLIQPGDYVDVHLTATVEGTDVQALGSGVTNASSTVGARTSSAIVARGVRVLVRRNSLLPKDTPLGPDCCINYTLATNPYRAALIDYVKTMGILALHPVSSADRARYEADYTRRRDEANNQRLKADTGVRSVVGADRTADVSTLGYCATNDGREDERIVGVLNGTYTIGEKDLMELFGLKYVPAQQPQQRYIERISGVNPVGSHVFGARSGYIAYDGTTGYGPTNLAVGGIRATSGNTLVDATGQQIPVRFRAPDALCLDRQVVAAPVVRRRG